VLPVEQLGDVRRVVEVGRRNGHGITISLVPRRWFRPPSIE
jgi:hypothetical protein